MTSVDSRSNWRGIPAALIAAMLLGLAGCVAMSQYYVTFEAQAERVSGLSPKSSFNLVLDPNQPAAVQGMFQRAESALRAAGFDMRGPEEADFIIHLQVAYSARKVHRLIRLNTSSGMITQPVGEVSSMWRYLVFYAYDQRDLRRNVVIPVWGAQVVADSRELAADDGAMVAKLFSHLGQDFKAQERVTPGAH